MLTRVDVTVLSVTGYKYTLTGIDVTRGGGLQGDLPHVGHGGVAEPALGEVAAVVETVAGEGAFLHTQLGALLRRDVLDHAVVTQRNLPVDSRHEVLDVAAWLGKRHTNR